MHLYMLSICTLDCHLMGCRSSSCASMRSTAKSCDASVPTMLAANCATVSPALLVTATVVLCT